MRPDGAGQGRRATDRLGDGLDRVGLEDAADAVEDWGAEVASEHGATTGEQQLGHNH
ncbi:putative T7SS-secreted protein, partial [Streptomyces sp. NPDC057424]|uniref:putative T7SS-secreted protein n=1 Tax=Streptomyces sp. NPDC057424 TaxID=3346127 RepID=UPI0036911F9F